jgi:hypothetical protein
MFHLKLSVAPSVRITAGEAPSCNPIYPPRVVLSYSVTKRMTVFKTPRGRAAPVGREDMDVRSRRVIFTHDWRRR